MRTRSRANNGSIELLNALLQLRTYHSAIYEITSQELKETTLGCLFTRLAQTATRCQNELRYEIRKMGGVPIHLEQNSTVVNEKCTFLRLAMSNGDRKAIFDSCQCESELCSRAYKKVLAEHASDHLQKELLQKHYTLINEDLTMICNLRNAFRA
jgi:uncharacterized protein (TIGR02284 family)